MKPTMPHVPFNNPYHRSQGNFFQSQQAAAYARAAMPMYSTTVTNAPIAMMNYFNTAANQQAMNMEQDSFVNQNQQMQLQPPKKQLSIDLVSDFIFLALHNLIKTFFQDISQIKLSSLSSEEIINLLGQVGELKGAIEKLGPILRENAITGRVLLFCDLNELKPVLQLNFGHWEIFKLLVLHLRDVETSAKNIPIVKTDNRDINDGASSSQQPSLNRMKQKSVIEKQVCPKI